MGIDSREIELVSFNERGIWTSDVSVGHIYDSGLLEGISDLVKGRKTFWDIGCGDGTYTKELRRLGFEGGGIDGNPNTPPGFLIRDLTEIVDIHKRDLCICLEVGEHIPKEYEQFFIHNLCNASDLIILSWASEYQTGAGHVNSKTNTEVINLFKLRDYHFLPKESFLLRTFASHWYFKKNLLVFNKNESVLPALKAVS